MDNRAIGGRAVMLDGQDGASSLAALLDRVTTEIDSLVVMIGDMQTGLSPMIVDKAGSDPAAFKHAQNIDLVWQILGSLSLLLRALKEENVARQTIDIDAVVRFIPLANLAARLRGKPTLIPAGDDLDLF